MDAADEPWQCCCKNPVIEFGRLTTARPDWKRPSIFDPHVVLLDIGLPELDGFEVAKRIRQQPTLNNIVLVAMTGYGRETDRQRSQEAGFDHHLVKPADFGKVQQILATVSEKAT